MKTKLAGIILAFLTAKAAHGAGPAAPRGSLGVHDPSGMIQCNGRYYIFSTGQGILSKSSADKVYWVTGPSVFANPPSWTTSAVPGFTGNFWAPHAIFMNGQYYLYYAVSTFGSQVSAIGLATNPTLDPGDPAYQWTDQGPVFESTTGSAYNCIDPSVTFDSSGNLWMSFGSFWNGIYMVRLDPLTGLLSTTPTLTHLAIDSAAGDPIEASYLYAHGGYYYLFANWGTCCAGINSTYNIRVGRSASITGPYLDRNGLNMVLGGGTLFLKTTGKYIGPGQIGILDDQDGVSYFSYHYYDADANGAPTLDIEPLSWTADGWPFFTNDWRAQYQFHFDARDDGGEYYGLLQNGASVGADPSMGSVLNLNGTNQYASLPPGAANAGTVAAVFQWNGGTNWQRLFDFGRGTNSYAFLTPQGATGKPRFAITSSGNTHEQVLDASAALTSGTWTHVAVTMDGSRGVLYLNGLPVATNLTMTLTLPDIAPTSAWFGRSQFSTDPYFNGQISGVRLYGRVLSPAEIIAPVATISSPAAGSFYSPGGTINFSGNATDFADAPLSVTGLAWTVEFHESNLVTTVLGPLAGVSAGSYTLPSDGEEATNGFHRIVLIAADTLGRSATNYVDVFPGPVNPNWTSLYPFDNGAADANGNFNGTLFGGASTLADPIRGPVLNLSSASQYVSLPAGAGGIQTFAGWVKWNGGTAWQRIFDFGRNSTSYAMLTARASNGALRFEITPNGSAEARDLDAPALTANTWTHIALTLDGRQAVLFINGKAVAVNVSVNLLPADVMGGANYFGRSQFPTDPYFNGQLDSVQLSSQCLPIEQITASTLGATNSGAGITLNWPAWNSLALFGTTNLGAAALWTPVTNNPATTNGVRFVTVPATNGQMFFRLQLP